MLYVYVYVLYAYVYTSFRIMIFFPMRVYNFIVVSLKIRKIKRLEKICVDSLRAVDEQMKDKIAIFVYVAFHKSP